MAERHAGWVDGVDSAEARLITGALTQAQGTGDVLDPLRVRSGLRDGGGNPGKVALGTNKVTVNPFQAVLGDPAKPGDGPYVVTLDAAKDLPFGAAHVSLSRYDLVVAEIVGGGFAVNIYAGENSASPVRPVPGGSPSLVLAEVLVPPAGTAPTLTDRRQFTAAMSGILPVRGDLDLPPAAQAHGSQLVYRIDTGVLLCRKGNAWVPYRPPRGDTWHAPTLQNGWVNYGAGYNDAAYTITDDGWVRLRGLVKNGSMGKPIFTLPVGYRPVSRWLLGVTTNADAHGRCDILTDGQVFAYTGSPGWYCLDDITFSTY
ncbi:hypothetical protein ACFWY9_14950 [Amycolatopsis sp. NPDC059027]|uniref:hypothetical protein n=1 Tax=unclassified Amycolatopsis TaxID=2618356 RepID=UPI00366BCF32